MFDHIREWIEEHKVQTLGAAIAVVIAVGGVSTAIAYSAGVFEGIGQTAEIPGEEQKSHPPVIALYSDTIVTGINAEVSLQDKVIESIYAEAGVKDVSITAANEAQKNNIAVTDIADREERNGVPAKQIRFSAEGTYTINITVTDQEDSESVKPVTFEVGNELMSYVQGLQAWSVEAGTADTDFMAGVTWNEEYVASVTVDASNVDTATPGTYALIYRITATDKLGGTTMEKTVNTTVTEPPEEEEPEEEHEHNFNIPIRTTVEHPAETHTERQWIVDQEAWTETIEHEEVYHYENVEEIQESIICSACGANITGNVEAHLQYEQEVNGITAGTETVSEPVLVQKKVVDQEAWTETIEHPEQGHYEDVTVVDREAWTETRVTGYRCACGEVE